ncbi:redoxin domain-containing protein [uncultured Spirosoma sp.]|uniref:redoxin domain-containing protein n=1 Tax=uncultured Spirosoma sp. TaxID=278208 RepID=UPI002584215A|nr:redoxin domain-containing protein [uncultured Spirosoma sp.]
MKTILLLLVLSAHCALAQPNTGQPVPDFSVQLLNAPITATTLSAQRGKLVLLEFWATWCSPCVAAMPHLQALQQRHARQLQVITVTDETPKRIGQFLTNRPSSLWFAIDTAQALTNLFPHQILPHTVLIGPDGTLLAQTSPERVTDGLIDSLWRNLPVTITPKADITLSLPEIMQTYFRAADTTRHRFVMQGPIAGAPGVQMTHATDSLFAHRRLTCLNLPLTALYRIAYEGYSYKRSIDKTGLGDDAPVYCLDLIVDKSEQLLPTLRDELNRRFDLKASLEPQAREVSVLQVTDPVKFRQVPRNKAGKQTFSARQGEIEQQAVTMVDFAQALEDFGSMRGLVVDGTGNDEKLDITLSFQPEDPQSLPRALAQMGLGLVKQKRDVMMLVLQP